MSVMKRLQKYIKNKKGVRKKPTYKQGNIVITKGKKRGSMNFRRTPDTVKLKSETKPVKRKGQTKASTMHSRYDPSTDQWIKYTD